MMLPKFMNPFKVECQQGKRLIQTKKHSSPHGGGCHASSIEHIIGMDVGVRLLTQIINSKGKSDVLVKSALRKVTQSQTIPVDFCFLKTCNLCSKQLSPHKDIYRYR